VHQVLDKWSGRGTLKGAAGEIFWDFSGLNVNFTGEQGNKGYQ